MQRLPAKSILLLFILSSETTFAQWIMQKSMTTARLRGISAVNTQIAWASGNKGTCLKTIDGGTTWQPIKVPGAEELDFRDVEAFDAHTAYLLSIGEGELSRIYKTTDGGLSWSLQFTNRHPQGFFDAIAFWDAQHGIALGDPVNGRFLLIETSDGGTTWKEIPFPNRPQAIEGEAAFAASGTCISTQGKSNVWFATGGAASRVFRSTDRGQTWEVSTTSIPHSPSAGIFSIAFADARNGVIVGGDYKNEAEANDNSAITNDGGRTWKAIKGSLPNGYRSAVAYVLVKTKLWLITTGPSGTDYSTDKGVSWAKSEAGGFHALSFAKSTNTGWAVGENGRIARFVGSNLKLNKH